MTASADQIVEMTAALLLLAHVGVLVWALRKGIAPVLALNLLVSAGVLVYWAPHIFELLTYADAMLAFVGFELVVAVTSLVAFRRVRVPHALIWGQFAAHALLTAAALAFMLTFKIDRLM